MTLTTERLKWLHDVATELSATKLKMTMRPDELLVLTSELLANREAQPVGNCLGEIRVGNLPTMNQEEYPGLGDWWVQLRIGANHAEILARVYGATPEEAVARARLLTAPPAPAVVNGRTANGWMAEALLQRKIADDIRKSAPAVPEKMTAVVKGEAEFVAGWNACRAAMLAQPAMQYDELPYDPQIAAYEKIMEQAIPDGYKLVPVDLTDRMIDAFNETPPGTLSIEDLWRALLASAPEGGNYA